MKKSPLRRKKGLRKVSSKHKRQLGVYYAVRENYLQNHPICEACKIRLSTEIHHMKGRGKHLCNTDYFMAVDRGCHRWIHDHPAEARTLGLLISKFQKD